MTRASQAAPAPAGPGGPRPAGAPRRLPGERAWKVLARTVHIAAMGVLLGGVAFAAPHGALLPAIALTVASGLLLLGLDLWKGGGYLTQGNGAAVVLKLALLGLGQLLPAARLEWYLAATVVASVGSHMPRSWRHWSFVHRRVMD